MEGSRSSKRDGKSLFHMTCIENLPGIIEHGLLDRATLQRRKLIEVDVADAEILDGRGKLGLDSMVPFHFMAKSPFDYRVTREHPRRTFVILLVARDFGRRNGFRVMPRHPLSRGGDVELLDWDVGIDAIDWHQMDKYPRPWETDAECKAVCMAEALSPSPVPFDAVFRVAVRTEADKRRVIAYGVPERRVWKKADLFPGSGG